MALYNLLPFILYREMNATPLQITALVMLKPAVSLASFHWSHWSEQRTHSLRRQLVLSEVLSRLPFLLFPWMQSAWPIIVGAGLHVMFSRGAQPAWMELLKRDLEPRDREKVFASGSTLFYLGMLVVGLGIGPLLDFQPGAWKWLAFAFAFAGLPLYPLLLKLSPGESTPKHAHQGSLLTPWIETTRLMKADPAFSRFQWGFFLAGGGLILMQPALPGFLTDHLHLSYTGVSMALNICKGVGFAATSRLWAELLPRYHFLRTSAFVAIAASAFSLLLLVSPAWVPLVYGAYFLYGVMQAGSELSWNLSGTIFSGQGDSRPYTRVSILMQGVRGAFVPLLGSALVVAVDPSMALIIGSLLCVLAIEYLDRGARLPIPAKATNGAPLPQP